MLPDLLEQDSLVEFFSHCSFGFFYPTSDFRFQSRWLERPSLLKLYLQNLASTNAGIFSQGLNLIFQQAPVHDTQSTILGEESTVILGAGVIGLPTTYYLALSLKDRDAVSLSLPPQIFVIEPSHGICHGASSGARYWGSR